MSQEQLKQFIIYTVSIKYQKTTYLYSVTSKSPESAIGLALQSLFDNPNIIYKSINLLQITAEVSTLTTKIQETELISTHPILSPTTNSNI